MKLKNVIIIAFVLLVVIGVSVCIVGYFSDNTIEIPAPAKSDIPEGEKQLNYVHFIDAGQGDCTLIETKNGKFIIIDASVGDAENKILSYLQNEGVSEIEYAIFTHPHEDHIGSADAVVENFVVRNVIMTDKTANTACYERMVQKILESKKKNGTKVIKPSTGDEFFLDGIAFTVLSDGKIYDDLNDSSICVRFDCGETELVFTGDARKNVERDMLENGIDLFAEIYKCAHHGSNTSGSKEFLDAVSPEVAIISCAYENDYGHPHDEVVEELYRRNITEYRTYRDGDIVIGFDENDMYLP